MRASCPALVAVKKVQLKETRVIKVAIAFTADYKDTG